MKALFFLCALLLSSCENVLWNDLGAQGEWKKGCTINSIDVTMLLSITNDRIRWKEEDAADWEEDIPCAVNFGVLYLKFPEKTIKGSYIAFFNYLVLSEFTWNDRLNWLNGGWMK
jgi:hypothetical protein